LQKLDVTGNKLTSLPDELSSLRNLEHLVLQENHITIVPVSVLEGLTALTFLDLSLQFGDDYPHITPAGEDPQLLEIPSSLLPILHTGLLTLDMQQTLSWDSVSLSHLGNALAAAKAKSPPLTLHV
jgi:Leucine-rich repeat (LRR) protein